MPSASMASERPGAGRGGGRQPRLHPPRADRVRQRRRPRREGGLINADFIDNSAGVDCSDHEVNLKILLDLAERRGELTPRRSATTLLAEVTEDVVAHVLYDSFLQAQIIVPRGRPSANRAVRLRGPDGCSWRGLSCSTAPDEALPTHRGDRPSAAVPAAASSAPELATLRRLRQAAARPTRCWSARTCTDEAGLAAGRQALLPRPVVERFGHLIAEHPLRCELVATLAAQRRRQRARPDVLLAPQRPSVAPSRRRSCAPSGSPAR